MKNNLGVNMSKGKRQQHGRGNSSGYSKDTGEGNRNTPEPMKSPEFINTPSGRDRADVTPPTQWAVRLAWLPIPLLLAAITGLWVADLRTVYESKIAMVLLNLFFTWLASLCICLLTARGFLATGQPGLFMFGCGSLLWGSTSLVAAMMVDDSNANPTITVHNLGILVAAFCHFVGLLWRGWLHRPGSWLAVGYASALTISALIAWAAWAGWTPLFFVQGQGGTLVRQVVLFGAIVLFAWVAWRMIHKFREQGGAFYYWYGLGLALVATGLIGVMLLSVQGSILGWINRLTQYLGSAYLLVAALAAAREAGDWKISLATLEDAWRRGELRANIENRPLRLVLRYGSAFVAVAVAFWVRQAITAQVGPGFPPYILFAATGSMVAIFAGFWPGLLATLLTDLTVSYWILPPTGQFSIESPVDRLGLIVFTGVSLLFCTIVELYRRTRYKADAYDRELALREGREALRKSEELNSRTLQALPAHIAVINRQGRIVAINHAWKEFADSNEAASSPQVAVGANYCEVCRRSAAANDADAAQALAGIEAVMNGSREQFTMEYPCHSPQQERWFLMTVVPLGSGGDGGAVITHLNITARKQAEEEIRQLNENLERRVRQRTAELEQSNHALRTSEQEFRSLAEAMPQIVWATRADGWNIYFNQQWVDYTGMTLEESYGHGWNKPFHPDDQQRAWDAWQRATQHNERYSLECRLRRADGVYRWWLIRGVPMLGANGEILKWFGTCTDIEEIKLAEAALKEANDLLEQRVAERTAALSQSEQRYRLLAETLLQGVVHQDADGRIIAMNPAAERILGKTREEFLGSSSVQEEHDTIRENGQPFPGMEHPSMVALQTGQMVRGVVMGVFNPRLGEYRWISIDAVPVYRPGETRPSEVYAMFEDITARKQAQEALRESEQRLALTASATQVGMFDWNLPTGRLLWTQTHEAIFGYAPATTTTTTTTTTTEHDYRQWADRVHPDDLPLVEEESRRCVQDCKPLEVQYRIIWPDGSLHWIETKGVFLYDGDGKAGHMLGVVMDITARKQAQDALRESEQRYRLLADNTNDFIELSDTAGQVLYISPSIERRFGFTTDDVENNNGVIHPDDQATIDKAYALNLAGQNTTIEYRNREKTGDWVWLEGHCTPILDANGRVTSLLLVSRDITERKLAQEALHANEERLRMVLQASLMGTFEVDLVSGEGQWNDKEFELLGLKPGDVPPVPETFFRYVHPDDIAMVQSKWQTALQGETLDVEFRVIRADGQMRWMAGRGQFIFADKPEGQGPEDRGPAMRFLGVNFDITDRKQAEETSRMNAALLRAITDNSPDPIFLKDRDCRMLLANPATLDVLQKPAEEVLGKTDEEFYNDPAVGQRMMTNDRRVMESGQTEMVEEVVPGSSGPRTFLSTKTPYCDAEGRVIGVIGIARDITERKRMEEVQSFLATTSSGSDGEPFFNSLARYLAKSLEMDFICIDRLEGDGLNATTLAVWCDGKFEDNVTYALKDTPCGEVVGNTVCCYPASVCQFFPRDQVLKDLRAESYVGVTLWSHTGKPIGLIAAIGRKPLAKRELAETVLKQVALRAAGELERMQAEAELRISEERFRNVFEHAGTGIAITRMDGQFVQCNAAYCAMTGYSEEELRTIAFQSLINPEDREDNLGFIRQLQNGEIPGFDIENRYIHKNGNPIWVHKYVSVLRDSQGKPTHIVALVTDMSARKLAEAERQKFVSLADQSTEFIGICDMQLMPFYVNQAGMLLVGLDSLEQSIHTPVAEFFFPEDRRFITEEFFPRVLREGRAEVEIRFRHFKTGEAVWMIYNVFFLRDAEGNKIGLATVSRNITQRKRAEERLRESEERLRLAQNYGGVGVWCKDAQTGQLTWEPETERLYGLPPGGIHAYQDWADLVHPEDLARIEVQREAALAEHKPFYIEFRIRHTNGDERWIMAKGRGEYDESGRMTRVLGVNIDITQRKRAEEQLRDLNQRLSYHVDNSPLAVIEWGPDMRLVRWSGAAEKIFGWKADEVLGKRMEDFRWIYPEDKDHVAEVGNDLTTGTNAHRFSSNRNYRKDGAVIHCEWYNSSLMDDSGKLRSILSLVLDVTDRKAAEIALRQATEEWERTFNSVPDLIAILDNQHRVMRANRAMAQRLGLQPQDCIGVPCYLAVHGTDHPLDFCPHSCTIKDFQEHTAEVHEDRLGEDFLVTTTPLLDPQGNMTGAVHVARDISDRKRAEEALRQTAEELARSNKDLEQFAYVASHDLQEPLRQVTGFMNLLKARYQGKLDAKADEYIHYAVDGSTRMSSLITDLLAYSRVGSHGKVPTAVDGEGTLKRAMANLYGSISESGANITHDDLPTLLADGTQLTQLFQNLLGNAIKFRRPGVTPEIHVGARREGNHWVLSVKDNGIGIDPKYADRIFQIFQRLHGMGKYPGTGIGLAICKKIVERHGGSIWVESRVGEGSTFFFTVPCQVQGS